MLKFDLNKDDIDQIVNKCVEALVNPGTVILLPTETVYGLVCRWDDKSAIERIYELKGREKGKPLALFVDCVKTLQVHGIYTNERAEKLADNLCPGPLTVVIPEPSGNTVGFRIPDHPFVQALLKKTGFPLSSTSANRSGQPNALDIESAIAMLDGEVDIAVDGGGIPADRLASTVVMALDNELKILRQGPISEKQLNDALK